MIELTGITMGGRRYLVEFTCGRCGKKHSEPVDIQYKHTKGKMDLHQFDIPDGWLNQGTHNPLLCDKCNVLFKNFLNKEKTDD